jgi:hypothetical protein
LTLSSKDRRYLAIVAVGVILIFARLEFHDDTVAAVVTADSVPAAERRLERLRELASTVPGREAVVKQARAELLSREAGVLKADTAAQAQAQLLDVIRRAATANGIDARGGEEMRVKPLADDYGEVSVSETFTCGIEQLVNFLADLANQPQLLAVTEIDISGGADKQKKVQVRLGLSGVVPKKLVPAKKGLETF